MSTDTKRTSFEVWASHPDRHGKLSIEAHANGAYKDSRTYAAYYGWVSAYKQALEEAAKICDDLHHDWRNDPKDCAIVIRRLK